MQKQDRLRFIQLDDNEKLLIIVTAEGSGVLLSSARVQGKLVPVEIVNNCLTEVPWASVKRVIFTKRISQFKLMLTEMLRSFRDTDSRGSFMVDALETMNIGILSESSDLKPFSREEFFKYFFTDPDHQVNVRKSNSNEGKEDTTVLTCRGSKALMDLSQAFNLGFSVKRFSWDF